MKKLTIVDIAKMAGVGTTTVSRYFNNGKIKEETRLKIEKIVKKYNYKPNSFARALKSNDSKMIGIIVPTLHSYTTGMILGYIDQILKEKNYESFILNSNFSLDYQIEYINKLDRMHIDGIILLPTTMNAKYEKTINSIDVPVVVLGQDIHRGYSVQYDDYNAGMSMAEYIINKNHKKIAYIGVDESDIAVGVNRKKGIIDSLNKYNINFEFELKSDFSMQTSYEIVKENIEKFKDVTCLMCATDRIAYGAIKALSERNINIGENFSITGFGNYDFSNLLKYPLTTISFQLDVAAQKAVDTLFGLINDEYDVPTKIYIPYKMVKGNSVIENKKI